MASALAVSRVAGRSAVTAARSESPLRLLVPRSPSGSAWVFQSSYGGGFVGADQIALEAEVGAGATLLLSSQASSKVYRAARSRYTLDARVGPGAALVCWPDPLVCFAGSALEQTLRFNLAADNSSEPGGTLLAVETITAGRLSRGERWAFERLQARLEVSRGGLPWLRDATLLSGEHGALAARLEPLSALATAVLCGPRLTRACGEILTNIAAHPLQRLGDDVLVTASARPGGLVVRAGAVTTEALLAALHALLRPAACELLGDDPWARKW